MPRSRRRHHSKTRSSGEHREKRRRLDSDEISQTSVSTP